MANHYTMAIICMIISGICDAFDGTLARKGTYTKSQQTYGVQLDSLSDVICFGVFPALITTYMSPSLIVKIISTFYMLCGVIRLAYFNTLSITGEGKKGKFIGVPITTVSIVYPLVFLILRFINYSLISKIMPIVLLLLGISFIVKIEIPKVNVPKIFEKTFNKYVVNFLLFPLFIIFAGDLFYRLIDNSIIQSLKISIMIIFKYWKVTLLLMLLINTVFITINSLLKNSKRTKIVMIVIAVILMLISDIKYNIMGIPLELSDVNYLNPDNISMMGNAGSSIGKWIINTIIKTLLFIGSGILFTIIDKEHAIIIKEKLKRIVIIIAGIIIIIVFVLISKNASNFIIEKIYKTTTETLLNYESVKDIYSNFGFCQGMYINALYNNENMPEGYKTRTVNKLLNEAKEQEDKWEKANVVFILSEAFSYLENIDEIKFNKSLTPNINSYMDDLDKEVIDLLVPSYGGVSVNTEFEILTGASLSLWKSGLIAYTQYYNDINGQYAPNIIKEFNNNGYETLYLTPWGENSYKSKYVYNLFGADRTIYGDELNGENKGKYYSDKSLMEDIYEELSTTTNGNYKFIMAATGQNHYPYSGDVYDKYDINVTKTSYNNEETKILRNYAQGIYDADKELNNLYEKIQELETPTIIVFYGDHLPYTLSEDGTDPYIASKYFNTENESLNTLRKYTTKAVILSNYNIEIDDLDYINASYLGSYIINKLDLEISDYFKFIDNTREILPVFNRTTIYKNNTTYSYDTASIELLQTINNYKYVQYGSFYEYIK